MATDQIKAATAAVRVRLSETEEALSALEELISKPQLRSIRVTPGNYRSILKNIEDTNFGGSTAEYIQVTGVSRLEIPNDFENFEIEVDTQVVRSSERYYYQLYGRGGHHPGSISCDGCAYKGRFLSTVSTFTKEVNHPAYCANRSASSTPYQSILGRRVKAIFRCENLANGNVKLENYLGGVLVASLTDNGGWSTGDTDFKPDCPRRQFGQTGNRQRDEILNKAGVLCALRTDGDTVIRIYSMEVREREKLQ